MSFNLSKVWLDESADSSRQVGGLVACEPMRKVSGTMTSVVRSTGYGVVALVLALRVTTWIRVFVVAAPSVWLFALLDSREICLWCREAFRFW